ncbi:MAG: hypothetical protein IJI47_05610 [Eubacterium sp.]|nr:hypothetical protein [Eubacterium sp.]
MITEILKTIDVNIPDGILQDQGLKSISLEGRTLKMEFDIKWFRDYDDIEQLQKYKGFKKCTVELLVSEDEEDNEVLLESSVRCKSNRYHGIVLPLYEFVKIANTEGITVGYCGTAVLYGCYVEMELTFYAKKGKYKKYFSAELHTVTDEINYIWE